MSNTQQNLKAIGESSRPSQGKPGRRVLELVVYLDCEDSIDAHHMIVSRLDRSVRFDGIGHAGLIKGLAQIAEYAIRDTVKQAQAEKRTA